MQVIKRYKSFKDSDDRVAVFYIDIDGAAVIIKDNDGVVIDYDQWVSRDRYNELIREYEDNGWFEQPEPLSF
jgi:hypothetical protein